MTPTFDSVLSPQARIDPVAYFAKLRAQAPVFYSDPPGMWLVTRYDDVVDIVRRPEDFSSIAMRRQAPGDEDRGPKNVITTDPPHHTRLRNILQRSFTNRSLGETQPLIESVTDSLLERFVHKGEFDLVDEFTVPLPVTVIAELLGVEPERRDEFKNWSDCLVRVINERSGPAFEKARLGVFELIEFFRETIDRRRKENRTHDDLIGTLIAAEADEQIDPREMVAYCTLLLTAGNETTTNLIGRWWSLCSRIQTNSRS